MNEASAINSMGHEPGLLGYLNARLSSQFSRTWWKISGYSLYLNPPALIPGLWSLATARTVEGFSPLMMVLLDIIQASVMLFAIETRNRVMFYSMFLSVIMSTVMIGVWVLRGVFLLW
jgi:hypothetical protein